jgi:hypothetical protein
VPAALGIQLVDQEADPLKMVPLPLMEGTSVLQVESLYNLKVTEPVGLYALSRLALSPVMAAAPTVPEVGLAVVVMVGLAGMAVDVSPPSLHAVSNGALLASPE